MKAKLEMYATEELKVQFCGIRLISEKGSMEEVKKLLEIPKGNYHIYHIDTN